MEIDSLAKSHRIYYLGLALVAVVWGANFGISRWAMTIFPAEIFTFIRFGLALPFLFLLLKKLEGDIKIEKRDIGIFVFLGFLGVAALEIIVMYSIKLTTLANASLLNVAPWPIFAALLAPLFIEEKITRRTIVGGIFALFGVSFIILGGGQRFDLSSEYMIGNMMALSISITGAIFNLFTLRLMKRYSPLRITAWCILFGVIFMVPVTWGLWGEVAWADLSFLAWSSVFYNVIIATVVAFIMWNTCMKYVGATRANFYRYLVPATATLYGALFFSEHIMPLQMAGGVIIAFGLFWISRERAQGGAAGGADDGVIGRMGEADGGADG